MSNYQQLAADLAPLLDQVVNELAERVANRLSLVANQASEQGAASPWMSITSAAAYLDWPKQRLYKLCASGEIPHYKHEGRLLFRRDELDAWLSTHAHGDHTT
jgi:excisionase family DNA binding protein